MWSVVSRSSVTLPSCLTSVNIFSSIPSPTLKLLRMASSRPAASSSSQHIPSNNNNNNNNNPDKDYASVSPSSAIEFLTLCQNLKVLLFLFPQFFHWMSIFSWFLFGWKLYEFMILGCLKWCKFDIFG